MTDCIDIHTHVMISGKAYRTVADGNWSVPRRIEAMGGMRVARLVHAWKMVPKARESLAESPEVYAKRFFYDALVFDPKATRFVIDSFGNARRFLGL